MTFSRTNRIDRRRRVILDSMATDPDYALETARAKKRARARELETDSDEAGFVQAYRDPGYSQAVRQTCQQRMVQLIPVRRGTLTLVLTCMWILWCGLMFSHYWIHVRIPPAVAGTNVNASLKLNPLAQLFHLRSSHSIAHWLTCQLWMLTALAAWMIFRLRRHKLDDYRARYRVWVFLAIAALFSSFDASSSGLYLLGLSIDGWARKEIGYGGWPLVLATFASLIGILGIRLCNELKSAPTSVACWLLGLLAWAISALLGTGLIKTTWSESSVDMVVGGCWLGGILAVFQASGIYLRQTYIHAQKRFLQRNGANLQPIQWKMPKLSLRRVDKGNKFDEPIDDQSSRSNKGKWRLPWKTKQQERDERSAPESSRTSDRLEKSIDRQHNDTERTRDTDAEQRPRGRLFGVVPNRSERNERLETEPIREDDGPTVDNGLTKKRGWFGIGGNRVAEESPEPMNQRASSPPTTARSDSRESSQSELSRHKKQSAEDRDKQISDGKPQTAEKRGWMSTFVRAKATDKNAPTASKSSKPILSSSKPSAKPESVKNEASVERKRSWPSFVSRKSKIEKASVEPKDKEKPTSDPSGKPAKRGFFGMFDGFQLTPPGEDNVLAKNGIQTKPVPIHKGQSLPSTNSDNDDEDSDDNYSGRPMSKAERKKQRRTQQEDRRAA